MNPAYAIPEDQHLHPDHDPIPDPVDAPSILTSSIAFKAWFQSSKVVTSTGAPLMVFHGTARENRAFKSSRHQDLDGAYFTPRFTEAKSHAYMDGSVDGEQPYVIAGFIRINNPFVMYGCDSQVLSTEQVKAFIANGYDGVFGVGEDGSVGQYVVFDPSQIAPFHEGVLELPGSPVEARACAVVVEEDEPENASSGLPVFYHGTTRKQWRKRHEEPSYLNLTSSLKDAERYAEEAGEFEFEFEDRGRSQPIVLKISPSTLKKILAKPGVQLQPDWGWVEGQEHDARRNGGSFTDADATWHNSLSKCNGVGVDGFQNKFKRSFEDVNAPQLDSPTP